MSFSIFGLVLLAVCFFAWAHHNFSIKTLYRIGIIGWIVSDFVFTVGYFVTFSSFYLRYSEFFLVLAFAASVLLLFSRKGHLDKRFFSLGLVLLFSIVCSLVSYYFVKNSVVSILNSQTSNNWDNFVAGVVGMTNISIGANTVFQIIKLCMAVFVLSFVSVFLTKRTIKSLKKAFYISYCILFVYLLVECYEVFVTKSNSLRLVSLFIFGSSNLKATLVNYSGRLYGFAPEPSLLSPALFFFMLFMLAERKSNHLSVSKWVCLELVSLFFMFLSGSFSSLVYFIAFYFCFFFYIIHKKKKNPAVVPITIIVPVIVLVAIPFIRNGYYLERINRSFSVLGGIISKSSLGISSESARLYSIFYLLKLFVEHPFFGVGFNSTYSYSGISSMLGTTGLFGFIASFLCFACLSKKICQSKVHIIGLLPFILVFGLLGSSGSLLLYYPSTIVFFVVFQHLCVKKKKAFNFVSFVVPIYRFSL